MEDRLCGIEVFVVQGSSEEMMEKITDIAVVIYSWFKSSFVVFLSLVLRFSFLLF